MTGSKTLQTLFVDELRDAYDSEKQLVKALPKLARAAQHPHLTAAFEGHLEDTTGQVAVLEEVFSMLELKPRGKHCAGTAGIVEEGAGAIEDFEKSSVRDAALISGGRRAEHYEIAAYTGLVEMATALGHTDVARKLRGILKQEEAADKKLAGLAGTINAEALEEGMQPA